MIKKKYIKPSIFAKEARVIQFIGASPGGILPPEGLGDGEEDPNASRERIFFQDNSNSDWNSIWQ